MSASQLRIYCTSVMEIQDSKSLDTREQVSSKIELPLYPLYSFFLPNPSSDFISVDLLLCLVSYLEISNSCLFSILLVYVLKLVAYIFVLLLSFKLPEYRGFYFFTLLFWYLSTELDH